MTHVTTHHPALIGTYAGKTESKELFAARNICRKVEEADTDVAQASVHNVTQYEQQHTSHSDHKGDSYAQSGSAPVN